MNKPSETLIKLLETDRKCEEQIETLYLKLPLELQLIIAELKIEMEQKHREIMSRVCVELLNTFNRKCNYCAHPLVIECINDWFVYNKFFYSRFCFGDLNELFRFANRHSETVDELATIIQNIRHENEKLMNQSYTDYN